MSRLVYAGAELHLDQDPVVIGRHRSCGVQVRDDAASRQHARVRLGDDGAWWVDDLGSANGTLVNGRRIDRTHRLASGDVIAIGTSTIEYRDGGTMQLPPADGSSASHAALAGARFGGYHLEALVSIGTLGAVYRARHERSQRIQAVKVFDPALVQRDPALGQRLVEEVARLRGLAHPGLARLEDAGIHDGLPWLSLEWLAGETLRTRLARGPLAPAEALAVATCLAEALRELHCMQVVHGDLRPATLFAAGPGTAQIGDPGLGSLFGPPELPEAAPAEMAWYLSPEQAERGARAASDDVYALGGVLVHLLTGRPPCDGDDARAVLQAQRTGERPSLASGGLPPCLDALVQPMLARNPQWRPAGMDEVLAELARARAQLGGGTATATRAPAPAVPADVAPVPAPASATPGKPSRTPALLAGAGLLVGGLGALLLLWPGDGAPAAAPPPAAVIPAASGPGAAAVAAAPMPAAAQAPRAAQRWAEAQAEVDRQAAAAAWLAAEAVLADTAAALARQADGEGAALLPALDARRQRLADQAAQWCQDQLAELAAGAPGEQLRRLDALRERVPATARAEVEARRQELLAVAAARLQEARLHARRALEDGRWGELPGLAAAAAAPLAGTPLAGMQAELARQCAAVAAAPALWRGTWALTLPALRSDAGAAAVAALALAGERSAAAPAAPAQATRAVVLAFDDPGDLQFIDILQGAPRLEGGALRGGGDEPAGLACTVPVGSGDWEAQVRLLPGAGDGQILVAVGLGRASALLVRIEAQRLVLRCAAADGTREASAPRPAGALPALRLAQRAGTLRIELGGRELLAVPRAAIPAEARLRIEAAGIAWALDDLQLTGGG